MSDNQLVFVLSTCLSVFCHSGYFHVAVSLSVPSQGVRAVIAESFERIHRSNLVGMGIVPLEYLEGQSASTLQLTGREVYTIRVPEDLRPGHIVDVSVSQLTCADC